MSDQETIDEFTMMIRSNAWQKLMAWVDSEAKKSVSSLDAKSTEDVDIGTFMEERGIRKGMLKVIQEAKGRAEGR